MTPKQLNRKLRKMRPKTYAKIDKRWDVKMIGPVLDLVVDIGDHIYLDGKKLKRDNTRISYDGVEIEEKLWKLLSKVRRITQLEK